MCMCVSAPRCRGLYYDAVRTSCGHFFCAACIQPFSDCLVCGADIASREPEPRLQSALPRSSLARSLALHCTFSGVLRGSVSAYFCDSGLGVPESMPMQAWWTHL